ncbi:MAG TPA: GIY-YIG nuclease family protein [Candidatus Limnocylindrales bacterium]|nr:GIY-YIG nuclease family protein [Candidatus Limnocylindrales bacterium]
MNIQFEPTKSFCYRFARYELLDEIAKEPEAVSGMVFRMLDVSKRVIERHLTPQQLAMEIPAARADRVEPVYRALKFWVAYEAKHLAGSPFVWLGNKGTFRLKSDADFQQEIEEAELEIEDDGDDDDQVVEFDGWIYAFSFPVLVKEGAAFPIKVGKTISDVEGRVNYQCRSSAVFDNPRILDRWQVKRVSAVESAIHATLKSRGKWRENVPGTEWFDTTISEIDTIVKFVTQS